MTVNDFFELMYRESERAFDDTVRVELGAIATRYRDDLVKSVREQRPKMTPLSDRWLSTKRRHNLDLRKLIASGEYLRHIKARRLDQVSWIVEPSKERVKPYKFQKQTGGSITYQKLAAIHEYGAGTVPARPHWRPMTAQYQGQARRLGKEVQAAFGRRLRRRMSRAMRSQV